MPSVWRDAGARSLLWSGFPDSLSPARDRGVYRQGEWLARLPAPFSLREQSSAAVVYPPAPRAAACEEALLKVAVKFVAVGPACLDTPSPAAGFSCRSLLMAPTSSHRYTRRLKPYRDTRHHELGIAGQPYETAS